MKAIVALEEIIKSEEKRLALAKKQLAEHESGVNKLSFLEKTSTENNIEETTASLERHKDALAVLMQQDIKELEEKERLAEAVRRKNYYKNQRIRVSRNKTVPSDLRLEAMHILDELSSETEINDQNLLDIALMSMKLELTVHDDLRQTLNDVKSDFDTMLKDIKVENIKELELLNVRIPIIVVHFSTLLDTIKEYLKDHDMPPFKGFPKYESWWIEELWQSHQAYFALYKWKLIISNLCITTEQKISWDYLFNDWLFAKRIIQQRGPQGYDYGYAFDTLLLKYAELDEEYDIQNLKSMEGIILKITQAEDFTKYKEGHTLTPEYTLYKQQKIQKSLK